MVENLKAHIKSFVEERTSEICNDVEHSNEYRKLEEQVAELQQKIISKLPAEFGYLFLDYEDVENQQEYLVRINVYSQGVADGICLSKILDRMRKV